MNRDRIPQSRSLPRTPDPMDDIIEFEQPQGLGRSRLHGIVTDIARDERHYSGFHKLFRCLAYGEPYQLRKSGFNGYGSTVSYTTLRLEPLEQTGLAREVICFGDLRTRLACGDEVELLVRRVRGRSHFVSGQNLTLGSRILGDLCCLRPVPIALFGTLAVLALGTGAVWLLPRLLVLLSSLAGGLITLAAIGFLLYITVFRDIIHFFRRR